MPEVLLRQRRLREIAHAHGARILRNAAEVLARQHPLRERREGDAADAQVLERVEQGMLTSKYLGGIPEDARAVRGRYFPQAALTEENLGHIRALNELARERGQTLAQMAI